MPLVDARPTVDQPEDDPYLWLEDVEGERALAWVAAENDRTLKTFGGAAFVADRDILAAIPTWPWRPGLFASFVSIIVLPVVLFLIQFFLGRWLAP